MPKVIAPDHIRIASLDNQVRHAAVNLMTPGLGMPWEDRGSIGMFGAFFKTLGSAMFKPNVLLAQMRRPETAQDANIFATICSAFWFLSYISQSTFDYFISYQNLRELNVGAYVLNTLLVSALCGGGAFLLVKLAAKMFHKLTVHDVASKAPPVLVSNVMVYLMAPSIFALIPFSVSFVPIGPTLAIFWMMILWMSVGIGRLRVRPGGAIVGAILTAGAVTAIILATYLLIHVVAVTLLNFSSIPEIAPVKTGTR